MPVADHGFTLGYKGACHAPGFVAIDLAEALGLPLFEPFAKGPRVEYNNGKYPRRAKSHTEK